MQLNACPLERQLGNARMLFRFYGHEPKKRRPRRRLEHALRRATVRPDQATGPELRAAQVERHVCDNNVPRLVDLTMDRESGRKWIEKSAASVHR